MSLLKQQPSWQREQETNNVIDPLSAIYNESQWKVNKVSPLYNLQYDAVRLKKYASKIRQTIVSSVAASASTTYTVTLRVLAHLKYSEDDADGVEITVTSNETKVSYIAILLSWGECSRLDDTTHLPYLLERGEQRLGTAVKAALQTTFDCNIKQFTFTQKHLLQIGFRFLEYDTSRGTEPFSITFKTPQSEHKDKLKLTFTIEDVKIIWNGVKEEVDKSSELVNMAYQILQKQIFHTASLDITVLDITQVTLPKAEVKNNGMVRMRTPEMVDCVFKILNNISDIVLSETRDFYISV